MGKTNVMELTKKWIAKNSNSVTNEVKYFIYGNDLCVYENGEVKRVSNSVIVFRNEEYLNDEMTCRLCGEEHSNKIDVLRCCTFDEE